MGRLKSMLSIGVTSEVVVSAFDSAFRAKYIMVVAISKVETNERI